jgi:hypothetical protein
MRYMSDINPPARDLEDVMTPWGRMPRWKCRALALGEIQAVLNEAGIRADGVAPAEATADPDELPPRPAADDTTEEGEARAHLHMRERAFRADDLAAINAAVDALSDRLDRLEARQRAYRALTDLEEEVERLSPPEDEDDPEDKPQLN